MKKKSCDSNNVTKTITTDATQCVWGTKSGHKKNNLMKESALPVSPLVCVPLWFSITQEQLLRNVVRVILGCLWTNYIFINISPSLFSHNSSFSLMFLKSQLHGKVSLSGRSWFIPQGLLILMNCIVKCHMDRFMCTVLLFKIGKSQSLIVLQIFSAFPSEVSSW